MDEPDMLVPVVETLGVGMGGVGPCEDVAIQGAVEQVTGVWPPLEED